MYVKAIIILCIIIGILILYLFFRGSSNRSRVSDDRDSVDNIGDGIKAARESNSRTKSELDKLSINTKSAIKRTADIKQNNDNARTGVRTALDILKQAKDRDNN